MRREAMKIKEKNEAFCLKNSKCMHRPSCVHTYRFSADISRLAYFRKKPRIPDKLNEWYTVNIGLSTSVTAARFIFFPLFGTSAHKGGKKIPPTLNDGY